MGWNSKSGILKNEKISEDELWSYFNYFFSDSCQKTTTYKFAFLKSILDNLFNNIPFENGYKISYYNIFEKFAESFWNLVVKYNLRQQALNSQGKTSKIEQIFNELINKNPILQNLEFSSMEEDTKIRTIKKVLTECKKYVIGAFYGDFNGFLYGFEENTDYLVFSNTAYNFLVKYKMEIEKLNYYSWAKFLEKINEENVLYKILTKLDLSIPKRSPLDIYREILYKEFQENNCFYCGKKLKNLVHVDHFIPWSFIKEDKIWNFVLSCPQCNTRKNNFLPDERFVTKIILRNQTICKDIDSLKNPKIKNEFVNYSDELIPKLWKYARFSGFKPYEKSLTYNIPQNTGYLSAADSIHNMNN